MSEIGAPLQTSFPLENASDQLWDVLVVGAGPSGSLVAHQLAQRGCSVLLVDKASFPRRKVCGCYLSGSGLATLKKVGLEGVVDELGAPSVTQVRLGTRLKTADLKLPRGAAVSRQGLDTALIEKAIGQGTSFLERTEARIGDAGNGNRLIQLTQEGQTCVARCKLAIVADGIGGQALKDVDEVQFATSPVSLVGASAISSQTPAEMESCRIYMAIGTAGYVGALVVEGGRLDIAGAFAPASLKRHGPGELAKEIVGQSGLPNFAELKDLRWLGTAPLTRRPTSQVGERFMLIGDAAGYVEPFTGEGMSWALASAYAAAPLAQACVEDYSDELIGRWNRRHRSLFGVRKGLCRFVTRRLRSRTIPGFTISVLAKFPQLATPFIKWLNSAPIK